MQILTAFSLLIPAFSLVYNPRPLTLTLRLVHNAPLPNVLLNKTYLAGFILNGQFGAASRPVIQPYKFCSTEHCLSFGAGFSPVEFSAQSHSTSELLRTL